MKELATGEKSWLIKRGKRGKEKMSHVEENEQGREVVGRRESK
jgi:hypothetical protein